MEPGWRPLHEQHAISDMHIVIELGRPLSEPEFTRLLNAKDQFPGLTDASVDRGFQMVLGAQPFALDQRQLSMFEVNFSRYNEDATIAERVAATTSSLVYLTSEYTRWAEMSPRAIKLLETMLEVIGDLPLTALTVRYSDTFLGEPIDGHVAHPASLFRPGSGLVVPDAVTSGDYFHSQTGFFQKLQSGHKALLNCDIGVSGNDAAKSMSIMTSVKIFISESDVQVGNTMSRPPLHNLAQMAHIMCKKVLHRLMADEVNARIGLKVP